MDREKQQQRKLRAYVLPRYACSFFPLEQLKV